MRPEDACSSGGGAYVRDKGSHWLGVSLDLDSDHWAVSEKEERKYSSAQGSSYDSGPPSWW